MAKFEMLAPTEILNEIQSIERNSLDIFKGMTQAGAKVAAEGMKANATKAFKGGTGGKIAAKVKVTKPYVTKKNEVTTKAAFYGYIAKSDGKPFYMSQRGKKTGPYPGIPVPLLCNLAEFGASSASMPGQFRRYWNGQKRPIKRPAFSNTAGIEDAMLKAQKQLSGGLLE